MRFALLMASLSLFACANDHRLREPPTFPTTLHLADDLSERDEDTWMAATARIDLARGKFTFDKVERGGTGCGVYVESTASNGFAVDPAGGESVSFAKCKWRVRLKASVSIEQRVDVATHLLGHAVAGKIAHNPDAKSVMNESAGREILNEDVEMFDRARRDYEQRP